MSLLLEFRNVVVFLVLAAFFAALGLFQQWRIESPRRNVTKAVLSAMASSLISAVIISVLAKRFGL